MSEIYKHDETNRASSLFGVFAFSQESKIFMMSDNRMGYAFLCMPLLGADDAIESRITNMLNHEWPVKTIMQFGIISSDNINEHLNAYMNNRHGLDDELLRNMMYERNKFLRSGAQKPCDLTNNITFKNYYLCISVSHVLQNPIPTEDEYREIAELQTHCNKMLESIGLFPSAMDSDSYLAVMDDLLHHGSDALWNDNAPRKADKDKPLNEQILDKDKSIDVDERGFYIGKQRVVTMGVKKFPEYAYVGYGVSYLGEIMGGARGLRGNFLLNMSIYFPNITKVKNAINLKRQITVSQATGPLVKFAPVIMLKKRGFDVMNEALEDGDRPVKVYFSLSVFGNSYDEAIENAASARSYYSELGFQLVQDKYYTLPFFLNSIPLGSDSDVVDSLYRYKTMATRHASTLLPIYGDWKGTGTAIMNFISRNGQIMNIDLFDSSTNYNAVIAASSGSGKSFLTAYLITNYLSIGAKVWVIDIGRSYLKLCTRYGGDFVHFNKGSDICLNPFELIKDYEEEGEILVGIIAAMASPNEKLTQHQNETLKRVMTELWHTKGNKMLVDHIAEKLLTNTDRRIKDLGDQLFSFTSKGPYGRYFIGHNNVSFNNRFTVLELDGLQGRENLQQVVLLQLIYQIQQDMYLGDRDQRKIVIIDEAWALLTSSANVKTFIEHGYRRYRKYNGSAITITQGVGDLYRNDVGAAIVENSANTYLLRQKSVSIEELKQNKRLPLTAGAYELLKTVHTVPGSYSEIFFITEYGQGIGRLIVDPYQILLYSTKSEDVNAVKYYQDKGMSDDEAIKRVLKDRGVVYDGK